MGDPLSAAYHDQMSFLAQDQDRIVHSQANTSDNLLTTSSSSSSMYFPSFTANTFSSSNNARYKNHPSTFTSPATINEPDYQQHNTQVLYEDDHFSAKAQYHNPCDDCDENISSCTTAIMEADLLAQVGGQMALSILDF